MSAAPRHLPVIPALPGDRFDCIKLRARLSHEACVARRTALHRHARPGVAPWHAYPNCVSCEQGAGVEAALRATTVVRVAAPTQCNAMGRRARPVDYTPTHTTVGPSGPVRPSAVEQVRAADAPDTAPRCEEPWCRAVVERAGTLCAEHREQHRPRGLDAVEHEHGQCATALPGGQRVATTARGDAHGPHGYPSVHQGSRGARSIGGRR